MDRVQLTYASPPTHPLRAEPQRDELAERDHSVLTSSEGRYGLP